jgi:hypothetical protein
MSDKLKGLFGGGMADDNDDDRKKLTDFAQRYTTGDPADGYSDDEARENFNRILRTAPPDVIQRAASATYQNLPENRRSELNQMLQDRQQGKNLVDIQRTDQQGGGSQGGGDPLGDLFGGMMGGGGGGGLGDILGGLLGGGGSSGGSSGGGGGLGDILGGLLGGGDDQETQRQPSPSTNTGATASGGGIGDMLGGLLSGPMGKVIMGGIAAYAAKELMDQGK